jgi:hypothetical protein
MTHGKLAFSEQYRGMYYINYMYSENRDTTPCDLINMVSLVKEGRCNGMQGERERERERKDERLFMRRCVVRGWSGGEDGRG